MDDGCFFEVPENVDELNVLVDQLVYHVLQKSRDYSWMVHFDSRVVIDSRLDQESEIVVSVLFDSGALGANYISKEKFEEIREYIPEKDVLEKPTRVGLAGHTSVDCNFVVRLGMEFQSFDGSWELYHGEFVVLDMKQNQVIIGLPAIVGKLWQFFTSNVEMRSRRSHRLNTLSEQKDASCEADDVTALREPWMNPMDEEAPEEVDVPNPVQFEYAHAFLGKTREQALEEYEAMFPKHVSEAFANSTDILNLLRTKAVEVFVPNDWTGISGVPDLKLKFSKDMPARMKPATRYVNPRLYDNAEKEFRRLSAYMYEPSRSPWSSPIVLAHKATPPGIRFCGDYGWINKLMEIGNYPIPNVRQELDKIINFPIYLDIDLTNAFHQIRLDPETRAYLSVQTSWGQYEPKFMPEGIGPGSGVLQETVRKIFAEFDEWAIVIFDNILILAKDYDDAYRKFELFLDKCIEHNVKLKFAKSWLAFLEVAFFGYHCEHKKHRLTDDRLKAIMDIPFPTTGNRNKKMRSALGIGVFCAPFVINYSAICKHLTDLCKPSFNWDKSTWKYDYELEFDQYKQGLQGAISLFYPDYDLVWVLRTDACDYGVGGVLIQRKPREDGTFEEQVIATVSKKFSEQALKWPTIEKEGYGMFYCVRKLSYYLRGKRFELETDHANLIWMEKSEVPKIIRWRIYLQSYDFELRHIRGKDNGVADALSRLMLLSIIWDEDYEDPDVDRNLCMIMNLKYLDPDDCPDILEQHLSSIFGEDIMEGAIAEKVSIQKESLTLPEIFAAVHNGQAGHWGAAQSWKLMNKLAPGHGCSLAKVAEMVAECVTCQKTRKARNSTLIPIVRHLKPPRSRTAIGMDWISMTPAGVNGEAYILVIINLFTKHVALFKADGCTAYNLAVAVWTYWCNFGHTDMIVSDRGTDFSSALMHELVTLMGMRHVFSITDSHVNGSERIISEVSRHARAILFDKFIGDVYGDPTVLPSVQYTLNDHLSSETGDFCPFEMTFGSDDVVYKDLLKDCKVDPEHVLLRKLNDNLKSIRAASKAHVIKLISERAKGQDVTKQNKYQPGDFVLFDRGPKYFPKMSTRLKGPFEVIQQFKNDVQVRNVITGAIPRSNFSVEHLSPFFGSRDEAIRAAGHDHEQSLVIEVVSYCGNAEDRYNLEFELKFADGDVVNKAYDLDIRCEAFFQFCDSRRYLKHVTFDTVAMGKQFMTEKRRQDIIMAPGDRAFIDLRVFGGRWYESLELPDWRTSSYVMEFRYTNWLAEKAKFRKTGQVTPNHQYMGNRRTICGYYVVGGAPYEYNAYDVWCYGENQNFDAATMILVDAELASKYPRILG